jgi:DNA-binding transcriptional LysR family regulator
LEYELVDLLATYRVFVRVAEAGSFSAVAHEIGATQPAVSRQIAALEEFLGARLIQRTTRKLTLTEDGRDLLTHVHRVLETVDESIAAVGRRQNQPTGLVRVGCPVSFGRLALAPRIQRLLARYPELSIELVISDDRHDMIAQGLDLVVRAGEVEDASLVARRVGTVARGVMASTAYLQKRGTPTHPSDLQSHECVIFTRSDTPREWTLQRENEAANVRVNGRFSTDSVEAMREAVLTHVGIGILPYWLMRDAISAGLAVSIMKEWHPSRLPVHAVYPTRRHLAPRTRAVIDFILDEFRLDPALSSYGES